MGTKHICQWSNFGEPWTQKFRSTWQRDGVNWKWSTNNRVILLYEIWSKVVGSVLVLLWDFSFCLCYFVDAHEVFLVMSASIFFYFFCCVIFQARLFGRFLFCFFEAFLVMSASILFSFFYCAIFQARLFGRFLFCFFELSVSASVNTLIRCFCLCEYAHQVFLLMCAKFAVLDRWHACSTSYVETKSAVNDKQGCSVGSCFASFRFRFVPHAIIIPSE